MTKTRSKRSAQKLTPLTLVLVIIISAVSYFTNEFQTPPAAVQAASALPQNVIANLQVLDVGQGSSLLIRAQDGEKSYAVLIDAGEQSAAQAVSTALDNAGVKTLDLLIITHPHTDHYGGAISVLKNYQVNTLWMPAVPDQLIPTNSTYENFLTAIENNGCAVDIKVDPDTVALGSQVTLRLLDAFLAEPEGLNNTSLCVRIDAGEASFLVTGDAEVAVEDLLRENNQPIAADVFVAGHHGSNTSNKQYFLNAVSPLATVISVGRDNSYNLPNEKALARISAFGPVYRTDLNGTVTLSTDGKTLWVSADNINDQIS